jgi:hypothetical protein
MEHDPFVEDLHFKHCDCPCHGHVKSIYIYILPIHIHTRIYRYVHIYIQYMHTYVYACIHTHIFYCTPIYVTYVHIQSYIYIYTCVYTYMWVCLICWGHLKIQGLKFRGSSIRFSHDLIGSDKTWESEVEKSRDLNKKRGRVVEWLWRVGECFQQKMNGWVSGNGSFVDRFQICAQMALADLIPIGSHRYLLSNFSR